MTKYIFVSGGVVSGLGKGIALSSIGRILKDRGISVFVQKFDPYLNINAGTMSPYQHGEVFVTEDGAECDLDLGHYERFTDINTSVYSNITAGKIYETILENDKKGVYLGQTIQVVPHVTNEIKRRIIEAGTKSKAEIVITEFGGTVGDIESNPFLEAARQIRRELGKENTLFVHITLMPFIEASGEVKTKPTQHSVRDLRAIGIQPDIILCRSNDVISEDNKRKIALFCDVNFESVIDMVNVKNVYEIPNLLSEQNLDKIIARELNINLKEVINNEWQELINKSNNLSKSVTIGLIGKYIQMKDAYLSISEALKHAGFPYGYKVNIKWIDSEKLTSNNIAEKLQDVQGIVVPGGFGNRGIDGMIEAIRYARINNLPFLGICLGMQLTIIEYARNVLNIIDATSEEWEETSKNYLIKLRNSSLLRLGSHKIILEKNSKAAQSYQNIEIEERHRHRYEFNDKYNSQFSNCDLKFSGHSEDGTVEIVEIPTHKFFVAAQAHIEFKSRPTKPHPLFCKFIESSIK